MSILLRTQSFEHHYAEVKLTKQTNFAHELVELVKPVFEDLFKPGVFYRATMVNLSELEAPIEQRDLFGYSVKVESYRKLYESIDELREKHGKYTVFLGSSFIAHQFSQHQDERGNTPARQKDLFKGETERKRIYLPTLDIPLEA